MPCEALFLSNFPGPSEAQTLATHPGFPRGIYPRNFPEHDPRGQDHPAETVSATKCRQRSIVL